jgi:hypothetical protein
MGVRRDTVPLHKPKMPLRQVFRGGSHTVALFCKVDHDLIKVAAGRPNVVRLDGLR